MNDKILMIDTNEPTLDKKVEFLSRPSAYSQAVAEVIRRETHMSWVFLAGDRVYKLKKPVRFPYLDFSTLSGAKLHVELNSVSIAGSRRTFISRWCH